MTGKGVKSAYCKSYTTCGKIATVKSETASITELEIEAARIIKQQPLAIQLASKRLGLAERERCARIVERGNEELLCYAEIITAIRSGE